MGNIKWEKRRRKKIKERRPPPVARIIYFRIIFFILSFYYSGSMSFMQFSEEATLAYNQKLESHAIYGYFSFRYFLNKNNCLVNK